MNVYDIFGSGRRAAVTESKIEVVHEYVNEDFSGLMFGANNEDIAGPGGSDNNDSTSPIHGFDEGLGAYDNDQGVKHTRGSLLAKLEALPRGSDDFEWNRQRAIQHLKQGDTLRAKYYMMLMKRGEPGVAEGKIQYGVLDNDNVNLIIDKSVNKPDGIYSFRGILFRVKGGKVTHYAADGKILQAMGRVNTQIGSYDSSTQAKSILKSIKQGVAEGRVLHRDLKSWTDDAKSQGLNVIKPKNDLEWTHHATDKTGKVCGKFCTTNVPQNSRGFIHKQGLAEMDGDEVDYDDKYQAMVKRVGQKAREQQRHEPVDLVKLAQRLRQADKTTDTTDEDVMESRLYAMRKAGYDIL